MVRFNTPPLYMLAMNIRPRTMERICRPPKRTMDCAAWKRTNGRLSIKKKIKPVTSWVDGTVILSPPGPRPTVGRLPEIPGYEMERFLGRGGMGVVYLARHKGLNRRVALKLIGQMAYGTD